MAFSIPSRGFSHDPRSNTDPRCGSGQGTYWGKSIGPDDQSQTELTPETATPDEVPDLAEGTIPSSGTMLTLVRADEDVSQPIELHGPPHDCTANPDVVEVTRYHSGFDAGSS
jgi:hypothetical protein